MSLEEFIHVVKEIRPYTDYVYLHVKGEPMFHPQFMEILDYCNTANLKVNLTTNGTFLPAMAEKMLEAPALRQVNVSLHGYTEQAHGPLKDYMAALVDFANKGAELGKYTGFRLWTLPEDRQLGELDGAVLDYLSEAYLEVGVLRDRTTERSIALEKQIFLSFEEAFVWPSMADPVGEAVGFCQGGRKMLGILADGTVVPCCLDADGNCPLGNAFTQPMKDILACETLTSLTQGFYDRKVVAPLCLRCEYRTRFDVKQPTGSKRRKKKHN